MNKPLRTPKEVVDIIWKKYDEDKNGFLDKKEAKKFIQEICAPGSGLNKDSKKLMKIIDQNNDNKLSY